MIGRFRVLRPIGEGGMGRVFQAHDPIIDRDVAIKLMNVTGGGDGLRLRFEREARAIGRLHHPNIVTIFEFGEHAGEPFIVMEYVEGQTLATVIHQDALGLHRRLALIDALCAGIECAHVRGIIHRDIKPANAIVDRDGVLRILDFGLARALEESHSGATKTGTVVGSLNYMSPEQLEGQPVDHRTDIFAIGAVTYELLSGQRAFPGETMERVLQRILVGRPVPLENLRPNLPPDLVSCVNRCLEKDPRRRFDDVAALRRELAAISWRFDKTLVGDQAPPRAVPRSGELSETIPNVPITPRPDNRTPVPVSTPEPRRPSGPIFDAIESSSSAILFEPEESRWERLRRDPRALAVAGVFVLFAGTATVLMLSSGSTAPPKTDEVPVSTPASPPPSVPPSASAPRSGGTSRSSTPLASDRARGSGTSSTTRTPPPVTPPPVTRTAAPPKMTNPNVEEWLKQADDAYKNADKYCDLAAGAAAAKRVLDVDARNDQARQLRDKLQQMMQAKAELIGSAPNCGGGQR
jgi:serine/threonine-protein kinase